MKASVIVCTRNPKPVLLARLVGALRAQSAPAEAWELVVVDNGSAPPVAPGDLPPGARLVREEEAGLTPARLRGIRESRGDVLVFLDDDNAPAADYVAQAIAIFDENPKIGTAGGRIDGEFEREPPSWARPYLGWLAVRPGVVRAVESGPGDPWGRLPCGAGLCIRAEAARRYAERVAADPARREFDRKGEALAGSGDTDLALTALELGYRALLTPRLRLVHAIPASRLEAGYLERLLEGSTRSTVRLARMRGVTMRPSWLNRVLRRLKRCVFASPEDRRMRLRLEAAIDRGERLGRLRLP